MLYCLFCDQLLKNSHKSVLLEVALQLAKLIWPRAMQVPRLAEAHRNGRGHRLTVKLSPFSMRPPKEHGMLLTN
jgi:hypothetical protein